MVQLSSLRIPFCAFGVKYPKDIFCPLTFFSPPSKSTWEAASALASPGPCTKATQPQFSCAKTKTQVFPFTETRIVCCTFGWKSLDARNWGKKAQRSSSYFDSLITTIIFWVSKSYKTPTKTTAKWYLIWCGNIIFFDGSDNHLG